MAQELTDEEVFGGAPAAAAGELGDFEVGIGRPAGYPSASAVTPKNQASINFGTLLKDPGAALSMLGDRFTATGVDSLKHGSIGGLLGGNKARAEEHLRKALAYKPDSVISLLFLAELLIDRNRRDEARTHLLAAIAAPYVKGGPVTVYLPQFIVQ